jgi:prepilin-type processing-associated H-X9-DG protein
MNLPRPFPSNNPKPSRRTHAGFTAVELLAVIATLALLASVMATTMAGSRADISAVQCRNNLKQLAVAWTMYADDNRGQLVYNRDGSQAGLAVGNQAWVAGWLDWQTGQPAGADTNVAMLVNHLQYPYGAFLGPYVRDPAVFKCPADKSEVTIGGLRRPRARSVSMNNYLGVNSRTWTYPSRYTICTKMAQIKSPAGMFVILDELADSINDGFFTSDPDTAFQIIDRPANYHGGAGSFSFADGHAENHRWKDPRTSPTPFFGNLIPLNINIPNDVDIPWLQQRAAGVPVFP